MTGTPSAAAKPPISELHRCRLPPHRPPWAAAPPRPAAGRWGPPGRRWSWVLKYLLGGGWEGMAHGVRWRGGRRRGPYLLYGPRLRPPRRHRPACAGAVAAVDGGRESR